MQRFLHCTAGYIGYIGKRSERIIPYFRASPGDV
jgi:hypothetical protein